jgi:hypothetical protein
MARRHLAGLHTVFTAEDWSGPLRVASGIDGAVENASVKRYRGMRAGTSTFSQPASLTRTRSS